MPNPFYQAGDRRAEKVGELFAQIARHYDRLNDLQSFGLHRLWKRRVARLAAPRPGARALDACCGTGDLALALARHGAIVTGLDFSAPMLAEAQKRLDGVAATSRDFAASGRITFIHGDALNLPFPDQTFDIVTVGYGLRNLSNWEAGLRELWRVTRPAGRIVILEFGKPSIRLWRAAYFGYLRLLVPMLGRIACGNAEAYAYILESLKHYPAQQGVAAAMRDLGLVQVRIINLLAGAMSINFGVKTNASAVSKAALGS